MGSTQTSSDGLSHSVAGSVLAAAPASFTPNVVFVASLLLVSIICAAAAVGIALLLDKHLATRRRTLRATRKSSRSHATFGLVGLALALCVWLSMTGFLPLPTSSAAAWGAGLTLFALAAISRGLLRGTHTKRSQRPQTTLSTPLAQRDAA